MKTIKKGFLVVLLSVFTISSTIAQDSQPTMFAVHTDNVNFAMTPQYEKVAKEMKDNFVKHNIQGTSWTTFNIEDGRYVYVTPIKNMAELDNNAPFAELSEKMGKDATTKMFETMNECYDSHSSNIVHYIPELSYNPEGYSTEGKNHREYHFLYYTPKNGKAIKEAMKAVRDMFEAKGVKNGYSVLKNGFGSEENYYMVSISGEDDVSIAMYGKANNELFGDDGKAIFFNVIKLTSRYDQVEGTFRPDLSYTPKSN